MFSAASKTGSQPSAAANYIEDVFNTWVYTLDYANTSYTIQNNIDLSTKGGLVWFKPRSQPPSGNGQHCLFDTVRGSSSANQRMLNTNQTSAQTSGAGDSVQFNSNGFTAVFEDGGTNLFRTTNNFGQPYNQCAWTFAQQPKFFDVVTYTGNGTVRNIAHNLGSVPGFIITKRTDTTGNWWCFHRSLGNDEGIRLNASGTVNNDPDFWNSTTPTSTVFTLGTSTNTNASGGTYIAYLFAHNAGGFGTAGTDNVISCGTYTTNGSGAATVNLGYEPQFILTKGTAGTGGATDWQIGDIMRGMPSPGANINGLFPNTSGAEDTAVDRCANPTSTGFEAQNQYSTTTYIYMAIRKPMKVPTTGTSVFAPLARTGTGTNPTVVTTGTNPDLLMSFPRTESPASYGMVFFDKLRGVSQILQSANTNAEATTAGTVCLQGWRNTGFQTGADFIEGYLNYSGSTYAQYALTRASGFFDEVCYTGDGTTNRQISHNLTVKPEMLIYKSRNTNTFWIVQNKSLTDPTDYLFLQSNGGAQGGGLTNFSNATSTYFLGSGGSSQYQANVTGQTYVAYLFATCAGVSKVGSYTGNGTTQSIDCGFTGGARFVMIKRTNAAGDWYVYDTARGMTLLTDPYLLMNSTASEVATLGSVTTTTGGFTVDATILAAINTNAASYIFLAIA